MGVDFYLELSQEARSSEEMAREIRSLIRYELNDSDHGHTHDVKQIDGLIVSIPDATVAAAVEDAINAGIHVFGMDLGYDFARTNPNILGYVAQDEYIAGVRAAEEFLQRRLNVHGPPEKALFVNHNADDKALQERFRGFHSTLKEKSGIEALQLVVDPENVFTTILQFDTYMNGCQYDFVLLSGTEVVSGVTSAFEHHVCKDYFAKTLENGTLVSATSLSETNPLEVVRPRPMMIASFDDTIEIQEMIVRGQIEFALSPQRYLMSVLPVIFSTIYASTGKKLELPKSSGTYNTGPEIFDVNNMPSDTLLSCQDEAFPICPNDGSSSDTDSACPCTHRQRIRIAGVLHGVVGDLFWDEIFAGAIQAGLDMDITLELERFEPQESESVLYKKMEVKIRSLCASGVDGIFVSMPNALLVKAVHFCKQLRIPVININAGLPYANELQVQHIGQQDYNAGLLAGERMVEVGNIVEGYCVSTEPNNHAIVLRCQGFGDVLSQQNVTYGGIIEVPLDNELLYYNNIAEAVGGAPFDSWDGVGLVISGPLGPALRVQGKHQGAVLGKFDVTEEVFENLEDERVLFAIDQQQYLQGSMAVYLLSYAALAKQTLLNEFIETGPTLIRRAPNDDEKFCELYDYPVCSRVPEEDYNYIDDKWLAVGYTSVATIFLASLVSLLWMHYYRSRNVVRASQPLFLGMLLAGAVLSTLAILPLGAQTGYRYIQDPLTGELTDDPNPDVSLVDAACLMTPWFYGIGFSLVFSALCAKMQRVKRIFDAGFAMRKKKVEVKDVIMVIAVILTAEAAILLAWTFVDPPKWERNVVEEVNGYVLESAGHCYSHPHGTFFLVQTIFHAVCLFYVLMLCWRTSDIPTEFAEGNYISLSILCMFNLLLLAIPVSFLIGDDPTALYFVLLAAIFLPNLTVLCLIFCPKMYRVYIGDDEMALAHARRGISSEHSRDNGRGLKMATVPNDGVTHTY